MKNTLKSIAVILSVIVMSSANALDIAYKSFTLENGLKVLVHEDHAAPVVAVSVAYHVGAKDEKPGQVEYAHLFEHLMFTGSKAYDKEFFTPLEQAGATDMNAYTAPDLTHYHQQVPTGALDLALFLESDRMAYLVEMVTAKELKSEISVVINEKSQRDADPFTQAYYLARENVFPQGHPYFSSNEATAGDLKKATLKDIADFYKTYYVPNNATLTLAGDITLADAKRLSEKYFGHIKRGESLRKTLSRVSPTVGKTLEVLPTEAGADMLMRAMALPAYRDEDYSLVELAGYILFGGQSSIAYQKLVQELELVYEVSFQADYGEAGSMGLLSMQLEEGGDMPALEKSLDQIITSFVEQGPTAAQLSNAKVVFKDGYERNWINGGMMNRAQIMVDNELMAGSADHSERALKIIANATPADLQRVVKKWLLAGSYNLHMPSRPAPIADEDGIDSLDRSTLPAVAPLADIDFPAIQRANLSNGIEVVYARREDYPFVDTTLVFKGGNLASSGTQAGLAPVVNELMQIGGINGDSPSETENKLSALGAELSGETGMNYAAIRLSAKADRFAESLGQLKNAVSKPSFDENEFAILADGLAVSIQDSQTSADGIASRLVGQVLYGKDHPLAWVGTEQVVPELAESISLSQVRDFHRAWYRPEKAKIVVVADQPLDKILPVLEKTFSAWKVEGEAGVLQLGSLASNATPKAKVYLADMPGAEQSSIIAVRFLPSIEGKPLDRTAAAIEIANEAVAGGFTSRVNANIRVDKGWTYGAGAAISEVFGPRVWQFSSQVQTDKTADAISEVNKELARFQRKKPIMDSERKRIVDGSIGQLPTLIETGAALSDSVLSIVVDDLPDDYYTKAAALYRSMPKEEVQATANYFDPKELTWLVVGDLEAIEADVRKLGLGEVQVLEVEAVDTAEFVED